MPRPKLAPPPWLPGLERLARLHGEGPEALEAARADLMALRVHRHRGPVPVVVCPLTGRSMRRPRYTVRDVDGAVYYRGSAADSWEARGRAIPALMGAL